MNRLSQCLAPWLAGPIPLVWALPGAPSTKVSLFLSPAWMRLATSQGQQCAPPPPPPPGRCEYRLSVATLPSHTGGGTLFLPMGTATMIMFPEGQIIFSGRGPGTYPVGEARGPGDAQGATLTVRDGVGMILPLSSADGGTDQYLGRTIRLPPAATVRIISMDVDHVAGILEGVFFVSGQASGQWQGYNQFDHVTASVYFYAVSAAQAANCPP